MTHNEPIAVIGAGFAGISAAAFLAQAGHKVVVIERLPEVGGRAQVLQSDEFRFDMGPSWYLMPEEHDRWFRRLGQQRKDYYQIARLDPNYTIFFEQDSHRVPADIDQLCVLFEKIERGAGVALRRYLNQCHTRYALAMQHFIYRQYSSPLQLLNRITWRYARQLALFSSYHHVIARVFRHPYLRKILSYPAVFLGSDPRTTPGIYTLMNWIDFGLGSWYPVGGFGKVMKSMQQVAEHLGVQFLLGHECTALIHEKKRIRALQIQATRPTTTNADHIEDMPTSTMEVSMVVAATDYQHVEMKLLDPHLRHYSQRYWKRRALAPSACNFYIGLDCTLDQLTHHTFFMDSDWKGHFNAVYRRPRHIENPLFYLHIPSYSDPTCAPAGGTAMFALIPLAGGLEDTQHIRQRYFDIICQRIAHHTGCDIRQHIRFMRSYSMSDYQRDFNAFQGTAFGLGHTLLQTAAFRPPNRAAKVDNLYYCGQWTIPGTGTTMSMISGELTATRIIAEHQSNFGRESH